MKASVYIGPWIQIKSFKEKIVHDKCKDKKNCSNIQAINKRRRPLGRPKQVQNFKLNDSRNLHKFCPQCGIGLENRFQETFNYKDPFNILEENGYYDSFIWVEPDYQENNEYVIYDLIANNLNIGNHISKYNFQKYIYIDPNKETEQSLKFVDYCKESIELLKEEFEEENISFRYGVLIYWD